MVSGWWKNQGILKSSTWAGAPASTRLLLWVDAMLVVRWRRAPKSIPLLDPSLILASLYGEGGENVGEHGQDGRHGAVRALMKARECTWSVDFGFLCLVHVPLPLCRKEDSVVFVYVSLLHVAMKTCFAFPCSMCKQTSMVLPYLGKVLFTLVLCSNFLAHS